MPTTPLSVSELTSRIRDELEDAFPSVWVRGEVSNYRLYPSGHAYFTLKDDKAQLQAVLFRGDQRHLKFALADGMAVIAFGRVSVYEARGQYQLIVVRCEPDGLGALQKAYEQLKARLEMEGLFAKERKRALPHLPRRIGMVTSEQGAVVRDMLRILRQKNRYIDVLIYPVRVQGEGAAKEIAHAIHYFSADTTENKCDVVIVARGGGSLEDLWAFNEEIVARAVFTSTVPVISAVGHETDFSICDFVADVRAPTPTAAAHLAAPDWQEMMENVALARVRLTKAIIATLNTLRKDLQILVHRLPTPQRVLDAAQLRLIDNEDRLERMVRELLHAARLHLVQTVSRLRKPDALLREAHQKLKEGRASMENAMTKSLLTVRHRLATAEVRLKALSPLTILKRGYVVVTSIEGKVLASSKNAAEEKEISLRFHDGELRAVPEARKS